MKLILKSIIVFLLGIILYKKCIECDFHLKLILKSIIIFLLGIIYKIIMPIKI